MTFEYWYMFPVAILVATTAMASGVGGATFLSPFLILVLRLTPAVAVGTGLITEVFGFASGLFAYSRKKLIDFKLGVNLLMVTVPAALAGSWLAGRIEPGILKVVLGVGLFAVALSFLRAPEPQDVLRMDSAIEEEYGGDKGITCLVTAKGERICYTVCNKTEGRLIAGTGGLFVGLISTGLGELNGYFLMQRCRVPSTISVGTSVFIVAVTVISAAAGHLLGFLQAGGETLSTAFRIAMFTVPGVVLGGQLGVKVASLIPQRTLERILGTLFILVGGLTLAEVML